MSGVTTQQALSVEEYRAVIAQTVRDLTRVEAKSHGKRVGSTIVITVMMLGLPMVSAIPLAMIVADNWWHVAFYVAVAFIACVSIFACLMSWTGKLKYVQLRGLRLDQLDRTEIRGRWAFKYADTFELPEQLWAEPWKPTQSSGGLVFATKLRDGLAIYLSFKKFDELPEFYVDQGVLPNKDRRQTDLRVLFALLQVRASIMYGLEIVQDVVPESAPTT